MSAAVTVRFRAATSGEFGQRRIGAEVFTSRTSSTGPLSGTGDADQIPGGIAKVGDGNPAALVSLRIEHDRRAESQRPGESVVHVSHSDVEDGMAVELRPAAYAARGRRRIGSRREERVFGRQRDALCDRRAGGGVPTKQLRVEIAKPLRIGTDQFEMHDGIAHNASLPRALLIPARPHMSAVAVSVRWILRSAGAVGCADRGECESVSVDVDWRGSGGATVNLGIDVDRDSRSLRPEHASGRQCRCMS